MSRHATVPRPTGVDVYHQLALRLQRMVRDEHRNNLSGVERFTVVSVTPLRIEHLGHDLTLEDGDPDFTVGAWVRQYMLNYALVAGDQVWCLREGQMWHAVDVTDPGGQHLWDWGTPGD